MGEVELSLLRPREPEALLDEEAFADDEFMPYWAELWPAGSRARAARCPSGSTACASSSSAAASACRRSSRPRAAPRRPRSTGPSRRSSSCARTPPATASSSRRRLADWRTFDGAYDLALAADVLYEERNVEPLARAAATARAGGPARRAGPPARGRVPRPRGRTLAGRGGRRPRLPPHASGSSTSASSAGCLRKRQASSAGVEPGAARRRGAPRASIPGRYDRADARRRAHGDRDALRRRRRDRLRRLPATRAAPRGQRLGRDRRRRHDRRVPDADRSPSGSTSSGPRSRRSASARRWSPAPARTRPRTRCT